MNFSSFLCVCIVFFSLKILIAALDTRILIPPPRVLVFTRDKCVCVWLSMVFPLFFLVLLHHTIHILWWLRVPRSARCVSCSFVTPKTDHMHKRTTQQGKTRPLTRNMGAVCFSIPFYVLIAITCFFLYLNHTLEWIHQLSIYSARTIVYSINFFSQAQCAWRHLRKYAFFLLYCIVWFFVLLSVEHIFFPGIFCYFFVYSAVATFLLLFIVCPFCFAFILYTMNICCFVFNGHFLLLFSDWLCLM